MNSTVTGSRTKTGIALIDVESVYHQHAEAIRYLETRCHWNMAILETRLLALATECTGTDKTMREALDSAYFDVSTAPPPTPEVTAFVHALYEAISALWNQHPWNNPDLIIYKTHRRGHHADSLAIEITYREPLFL